MKLNKRMKKIYIAYCLIFYASVVVRSEQQDADVRVLQSDASGITVEFTPRYSAPRNVNANNTEYQLFLFQNAVQLGKSGTPDVRSRSLDLALPGRNNNRVVVLNTQYEIVNGIACAPVAEFAYNAQTKTMEKKYREDFSGVVAEFPSEVASLHIVGNVKGKILGHIIFSPLQYNATTKSLKKYSRIVARVEYGNIERQFGGSQDDEWARASLLNYEVAQNWKTVSLAKQMATPSVLASGMWFKVEVIEDGMYKIDASYLRTLGVNLSSLTSIYDVKIFGSDGKALNPALAVARPSDLPPLAAFYYDANGNTKFDADDYVLFYGQGVTGWTYNSGTKQFSHYTNPYTNSNFYFVQINSQGAAKQMTVGSANGAIAKVMQVTGKMFFDEEKINFNQSGLEWFSAPMNPKDSRVISNKLFGYIAGTLITYKYNFFARADVTSTFTVEESGNAVGSVSIDGMTSGELDDPQTNYANEGSGQNSITPSLSSDSRSSVKITYNANSNVATGFIDSFEIFYQQDLIAVNDALIFTSPDNNGTFEFEVSGFSNTTVAAFDITDANAVSKIPVAVGQIAGTVSFMQGITSGNPKRFWIGTPTNYKYPKSFVKIPNSNVHGMTGAEFVIITHHDFVSEALRLKAHKENLPGKNKLTTAVIEIDTLYNEFGIGMPDPTVIRDFLSYAQKNWQIPPQYVLFMGDATYDYKSITGLGKNFVPTYETQHSNNKIKTYNYDDYFSYLDPVMNTTVSLAHGRLAVQSAAEAGLLVDRIIQYETNPVRDVWKNTITIVADDNWVGYDPDGADNTNQAEGLSTSLSKYFNQKKIYIMDYPTTISPAGRRKPEARDAIIKQVNDGTLVINYTGHGNPKVWAHESILTLDDTKNQFYNSNKLTFVVAATCDWGRFDETNEQSSGEEVMVNARGGAIGVLSATRAVYATDNSRLNRIFYKYNFPQNPFTTSPRLGDACMFSKNDADAGDLANKQKYHLLGDPTLRLAAPPLVIVVDSINGKSISALETLSALKKISLKASVRNADSTVNTSVNGTALVTVYDADRSKTVVDNGTSYDFVLPGAVIYKGENSIRNGIMEATFIVPKDISYENKNGKISLFFSTASSDGRGYTDNIIVGGASSSTTTDTQGPAITIYFDSPSFRAGDLVNEKPTLIVEFNDSSGINSAGSGIGHRIEAWIDDGAKSTDLTEFYKGKKDNYQKGTVEYQLSGLAQGNHTLKVKAWDVFNNSSTAETQFVVASGDNLAIENVYTIPNPISTTTVFTFQHNQLQPIDVTIKIYTVAGRMIHSIERFAVTDRFVQVPWNCRDRDGDVVGNGIYFYKVIAKTVDGRFTSEALSKLAVVK